MADKEERLNSLLEDALDDLLQDGSEETVVEEVKEVKKDATPPLPRPPVLDEDPEKSMDKFFADMKKQLDEMNPDEVQANINETVPELFNLMQNLLSKELLYPALKDLSPKFEEWMAKNNETLSKTDKKRYRRQMHIINEIIEVFDDESLGNQERFEKNLDLMEKMQSLGAPPSELTVPEGMAKCSIM